MHERRLALILARNNQETRGITGREIAVLGAHFRRGTSWLGAYADPREYAVVLGLRISCQPIHAVEEGAVLVGDTILYRGDADSRVWGMHVYLGIARALVAGITIKHALADRLRLVGQMAMGELLVGDARLEDVIARQHFCPAWLLNAHAEYMRGAGVIGEAVA